MQADECLRILRSIAVDLASELDLHYSPEELRNISPVVDHLREAFEVLEQDTKERVPAIKLIVGRHDDQVDAENERDNLIDPILWSQVSFSAKPGFTEEQYELVCRVLAEFTDYLHFNADDAALRGASESVGVIEEARRMLYVMDRDAPLEVERILARHYRLLLETAAGPQT